MNGKTYTIPQFRKALENLDAKLRQETIRKAALAGGEQIRSYGKLNVRDTFKQHTGMLLAKWEVVVTKQTDTSCEVRMSPLMIYARIQELGGIIRATTKKYLHWVDEQGGHHQAEAVRIPARPYLRPAVDDHEEQIIGAIGGVLRKEIEGSI